VLDGVDPERELWGKLYNVVLRKLCGLSMTEMMESSTVRDIASVLFPSPPVRVDGYSGTPVYGFQGVAVVVPDFSLAEVTVAVNHFKSRNKAYGLGGVSSRVWSIIIIIKLMMLTGIFNACLRSGTFPER